LAARTGSKYSRRNAILPPEAESGLLRIRAKGEQAPVTVLHDELP